MNISTQIISFYDQIVVDEHHRYKSWEYCFNAFHRDDGKSEIDYLSLHLSFYLASWGMYRGSSFLLWKDYKIHDDVVAKLLHHKALMGIDFSNCSDDEIQSIMDLSQWIKAWYPENITTINGQHKKINVTDTLVTKIILGSLGCVPAYDRYFIEGMRISGIPYSKFDSNNFKRVINFYNTYESEFIDAQALISEKSQIKYPAMKLMDMYFWQLGFEKNTN